MNKNELLIKYLSNILNSKSKLEDYAKIFHFRDYKEKDMLLNMNETTNEVSLILKGLVRGMYIDMNGNEITKCFAFEGMWCCAYNYLSNAPSEFFIEALEDVIVATINISILQKMIAENEDWKNAFHKLCTDALIENDKRNYKLLNTSAKERYLEFIKAYPKIHTRIKQEYIASYIGVTPSSLSRLKRSL